MKRFPRPIVLVSKCLEFDNVRYNGQVIHSKIVRDLIPFVDYIKICPEVEIGLGVPRDTIRIVKVNGEKRLIQPKTGDDVTEKMRKFTTSFLENLSEVDGFIFKSGSPTIGIREIKVYSGIKNSPVIERGSGFFAEQIIEKYSGYPMEEEDRLRNKRIRHHFLTQLFTFAAFRQMKQKTSLEELADFHKRNHYLFMSYHCENCGQMDELLENREAIRIEELFKEYEAFLKRILSNHPESDSTIKTVKTIFSKISDNVPKDEIDIFNKMVDKYEKNHIGYHGLIEILRLYVIKYDSTDIINDNLFQPYPEELQLEVDDDRDKDYWKNK